jgi:hypothetical protein
VASFCTKGVACGAVWVFVARWVGCALFDGVAWFGALWRVEECGTETQRHRDTETQRGCGLGVEFSVVRILSLYREGRCCARGTLRAQQKRKRWVFGRILRGYFFVFRFGGGARAGGSRGLRGEVAPLCHATERSRCALRDKLRTDGRRNKDSRLAPLTRPPRRASRVLRAAWGSVAAPFPLVGRLPHHSRVTQTFGWILDAAEDGGEIFDPADLP